MTNTEGEKPVQVEQADREAVEAFSKEPHVVFYLTNTRLEGDWRTALAQAFARHRLTHQPDTAAQPVAWMYERKGFKPSASMRVPDYKDIETLTPLYAHPPAQPVGDVERETVAWAIINGSGGYRAAEHAREFQTANWTDALRSADAVIRALSQHPDPEPQPQTSDQTPARRWKLGDHLHKRRGSQWHGKVVGFYSTELTPVGYAIESATEHGSVQIYPESALEEWREEVPAVQDADAIERGDWKQGEKGCQP